jgi:hypothetical protein
MIDLPPEYCEQCGDEPCELHREPVRVVPRSEVMERSAPGELPTAGDVIYSRMVMAAARARLGALKRGADERMRQNESLELLDIVVDLLKFLPLPLDPVIDVALEGMRRTIHEMVEP